MKKYFSHFYLDQEKDMIVDLYLEDEKMSYVLRTPNHSTGNLISNLAKMCDLSISFDDDGLKIIEGNVPCYYNDEGNLVYIFRLKDTKVANIYLDGRIERKASIPAISKTLMSQTKNYHLDFYKTVVKTFILRENKFHTDLHTHMNANLSADVCIALGIKHQIRYPLYYIKKLNLKCSDAQMKYLEEERRKTSERFRDSSLEGKYLDRKINDNTFINFADLILNNLENASYNIPRIRSSLAVMKDGQAVFTNLEKVYLYRYVFTKGVPFEHKIKCRNIDQIPDEDIVRILKQMKEDEKHPVYQNNSLFQDKLLWIARMYQKLGIKYVEISDTTLVKKDASVKMLEEVHEVMPSIYEETGVLIRFLAAFRRIPLTIVRDNIAANNYTENLKVMHAVMIDPYVAGSDIVGEEINDIRELKPLLAELTSLASEDPGFVIRIHAGENDSLTDNVYNSIACIVSSLQKGQTIPHIRIGHGLYTANLHSAKGKALIEYLNKYNATLEFQITSNVRLNNLSDLSSHPLKQYLKAGIHCVQGTDGGALYGTDSIDEQLALEKMLNLNDEEIHQMCEAEGRIIDASLRSFHEKQKHLNMLLKKQDYHSLMEKRMHSDDHIGDCLISTVELFESKAVLKEMIAEMPSGKKPVIIAGGSFNNDSHTTRTQKEILHIIDSLLENADPKKNIFVIGDGMKGYEKYLLKKNQGRFDVYAFVPSSINQEEIDRLRKADVKIRVAIEPSSMGIYKSIAYEIFKRRESILLALDGNSSAVNLIQEAKNAKHKCRTFVNIHSPMLKKKAMSLTGYITWIEDSFDVQNVIKYL